ncbi:hypothetical protein F2P81_019304 [Scophthalmus maximus]|uniref:Uncharacterized protein n=1 Tax=Scophthalmus maximus TaxID=52904 RepID=A0A6A4S575_SCOMX|nr:hypothetical protein F2P81_019304 [Scophthalmus maximus]
MARQEEEEEDEEDYENVCSLKAVFVIVNALQQFEINKAMGYLSADDDRKFARLLHVHVFQITITCAFSYRRESLKMYYNIRNRFVRIEDAVSTCESSRVGCAAAAAELGGNSSILLIQGQFLIMQSEYMKTLQQYRSPRRKQFVLFLKPPKLTSSEVLLLIAICHSMYLAIVLRPLRHTEIWVSTRGPLSPWRDQRCDLREDMDWTPAATVRNSSIYRHQTQDMFEEKSSAFVAQPHYTSALAAQYCEASER